VNRDKIGNWGKGTKEGDTKAEMEKDGLKGRISIFLGNFPCLMENFRS
jgi:hypothetical protein